MLVDANRTTAEEWGDRLGSRNRPEDARTLQSEVARRRTGEDDECAGGEGAGNREDEQDGPDRDDGRRRSHRSGTVATDTERGSGHGGKPERPPE